MLNRYIGTALGAACGDALGATLEFGPARPLTDLHIDLTGGGPFGWSPGAWTDDTQMAVAVAGGVLDNPANPVPYIGGRFLDWYAAGPRDVGATCGSALSRARMQLRQQSDCSQVEWTKTGARGVYAAGNGALMRTWPVALAYHPDPLLCDRRARSIARMTHDNDEAADTCAFYCRMLSHLLDGLGAEEALTNALQAVPAESAWRQAVAEAQTLPREKVPTTGYTVDTLVAAVWALTTTSTAEDCIIQAANLGGDADTIGAVAGGLAGACYGSDALPSRWTGRVQEAWRLVVLATSLYSLPADGGVSYV